MSMLTILHRNMLIGGKEQALQRLAGGLQARGTQVEFVLMQKRGALLDAIHPDITVHDLQVKRARNLPLPLWRFLRTHKPQTLLVDGAEYALMVRVLAWLAGYKPRIFAFEHFIRSQSQSVKLHGVLLRLAAKTATKLIAVSNAAKDDLVASGIAEEHVAVVYNAADVATIQAAATEAAEHPWLAENTPIIMGMGRLAPDKSYDDLLRGFAAYRAQHKAKLMLIGDGPERSNLEALATELGIADDIWIGGFVANPYPFIARASVFVHCSRSESFGNVILEALALGRPILIQEAHGGMQEIIECGYGAVVPRSNPDAMAHAIAAAIAHPPAPEKQVARARAFSVEGATQSMLGLLHD